MRSEVFDLREYDISISDGKATITRKSCIGEYADGEFLVMSDGSVFIHWSEGDREFGYGGSAFLDAETNDLVVDDVVALASDCRKASDNEANMLRLRLAQEGYI